MAGAGLPRESITHAVGTHIEGIGMFAWRNDDGAWAPFFPNARLMYSQRELDALDRGELFEDGRILKQLRELDTDAAFRDPAQFDRLQSAAAESVKRFEFNLRRKAELKGNEVLLSGDGDVPEEFRKLVEQYYKSLSKGPEKAADAVKKDDKKQ